MMRVLSWLFMLADRFGARAIRREMKRDPEFRAWVIEVSPPDVLARLGVPLDDVL